MGTVNDNGSIACAYGLAAYDPDDDLVSLSMKDIGPNKIKVIKLLREIDSTYGQDSVGLSELLKIDRVFLKDIPRRHARKIKNDFALIDSYVYIF
jgi:ribosomal protein L7/L12